MRVLSSAPDPRFGGPLQRSLSVAQRLQPRGIDTVFLVPRGDNRFVEQARKAGFECPRLNQPRIRSPRLIGANARFLTGFTGCVRAAEDHIRDYDIDLVHVNGPLNYPVALAAARSDAALVWHFNDTLTPTPLRQFSAMLARRWADRIVVAADAVADYFFDEATATTTLYAPVDIDRFNPSAVDSSSDALRSEFDIEPGVPIVGAVGNINPAKGYDYLIEAFSRVDVPAHLVVVGKRLDSQQTYYNDLQKKLSDLGIESKVTFTGWRTDVPDLLDLFDLFVLASVTEACPMVVLEAMAMECPVVATDVGGVCEQIPDPKYGWVIPPKDIDALRSAIESALSAKDRAEIASNGRTHVEAQFSLDACTDEHVAVYQSVLSKY